MKRLFFLALVITLTLSGCSDNSDLFYIFGNHVWPEGGGIATLAFEDLEIDGRNDYDYNDFVTGLSVSGMYSGGIVFQ
ncbi:MAG: lipoprotein, partial [Candidatus Hodarchaeota archaeon]